MRLALNILLLVPLLHAQNPAPSRQTVIVTGTYVPIPIEETDRAVTLVPVRGRPALLANSLVDFLQLDSSLDVRQRAPHNIQTDLSIRGGSFGQTLVLLNGLRLNDVQSGHHHLNVPIPVHSLERVEVLKGSGSTLYGSDAIGGVVNFVTRPPEASEVRIRAAVGNFGVNQQRISAAFVRTRLQQQWTASRDFSTGFRPNRDYRNLGLASTTRVQTGLGWTELILAHGDRPFGADQFYGNFNSWERTKSWFAGLRQPLGERTEAAFVYRRHTDLFVLYRDRPQVFTNRHATESIQATLRRFERPNANTTLHLGGEALHDRIRSNNLGNHTRARGAAYAALDVRALHRFSFTLGVRDEFWGSLNHQVSPSLSGGVWLSPSLKLRAGASRAFRLPTYTDLYYQDPRNLGSPDLKPERAWTIETGLDWQPHRRLRADATLFQRRERDGIDYVRRSDADIWRATNFQSLRFTGVETTLLITPVPGRRLSLSYTGLRGTQAALMTLQSKYVFNYPQHQGVLGWTGTLPGGLVARTRLGAVRRLARSPYAVWDLYAARSRGAWQPFVQFTNLTGSRYEEIPGVAMPGRAAVVGLEWHVR